MKPKNTTKPRAFAVQNGGTISTSGIIIGGIPAIRTDDPRFDPSSSHGIGVWFRLSDQTKAEPT